MDKYKLWFASIKLSNHIKIKLLEELENEKNIYDYAFSMRDSNNKIIERLVQGFDENKLNSILKVMEKDNINAVTFNEIKYPKGLINIDDPPYILFYKGNIESLEDDSKKLSIVGSRKATHYGKNIVNIICKELKNYNVQVISGMAKGIDGIAHRAALDNNIYTCAILGSGVNVIYPKENYKLYEEILNRGGCIISEFLPNASPEKYNFPRRNRIISGISDLVLVIEAGERSGSLITASTALEQGRDVMAVPGSVFSTESKGCNKLIKEGAFVFTTIEDIINLLNLNIIRQENKKNHSNISKENDKIYTLLGENPIHIDDIARATNIDIKQLYGLLFEMQLKDEIYCLHGNYYAKVNKSI